MTPEIWVESAVSCSDQGTPSFLDESEDENQNALSKVKILLSLSFSASTRGRQKGGWGIKKGVSQRILVLDDGRRTGIVTPTDVTKAFERLELMRIRTHGAPWASAAP